MQLQQVEGAGQGRSDREAPALPGHLTGSGFFSDCDGRHWGVGWILGLA